MFGIDADHVLDLRLRVVRIRLRQVHLVEHRHDLDTQFEGGVAVGHRLRLDTLAGIDHQQRAFAGAERTAHLVAEVDMARRVDQVEVVDLAVAGGVLQRRGLGLDRDAALALDVHRVEHLRLHLAVAQAAAAVDQAVGQRRLAVVDVGNDGEVADVVHGCDRWPGGAPAGAAWPGGRQAGRRAGSACAGHKKKARPKRRRAFQQMFGNCLLGLHCSQNDRAGNRAAAASPPVAGCQHDRVVHRLSTVRQAPVPAVGSPPQPGQEARQTRPRRANSNRQTAQSRPANG